MKLNTEDSTSHLLEEFTISGKLKLTFLDRVAGGENFSKYQSFGSEMFTYTPNGKKGLVSLEKANKN